MRAQGHRFLKPNPAILRAFCAANPGSKFSRKTWTENGRVYAEVKIRHADGRVVHQAGDILGGTEQAILDWVSSSAVKEFDPPVHLTISGLDHGRARR